MVALMPLDGPRIYPPAGRPAKQLVVLLHGYGADGNDLIGLAPHWQNLLPDAAFVAPNAPERIPGSPFGFQWFSLNSYDPDLLRRDPRQSADIYRQMRLGAEAVAASVQSFIDAELRRLNLESNRLALVGFSQGTMMALYCGLRREQAPAGIVGFSGALVGGPELKQQIRCRPPIFLVHGDVDEVVPVQAMFGAASDLAALDLTVEWHVCPGLGHGIDPEGLELAGRRLREWLR